MRPPGRNRTVGSSMAKDPVCAMEVEPEEAAGQYEHRGETYYFCHPSCLEKFRADPEKYLTPAESVVRLGSPQASPAEAPVRIKKESLSRAGDYTCPMHPEV